MNLPLFADHERSVDFKLCEDTFSVMSREKPASSKTSLNQREASVEDIGVAVNLFVLSDHEVMAAQVNGLPTLWIFLDASHAVDQG